VLVEGPGKVADKIDAWTHVALYKILAQLPESAAPQGKRRRAPRVPFYVARGLTEESGGALVERLRDIGLEARMVLPSVLAPKPMRAKARQIAGRYLALFGFGSFNIIPQALRHAPHVLGGVIIVALPTSYVLLVVATLLSNGRPLVIGTVGTSQQSLGTDLSRVLRALTGRHDRRLVGRVLERVVELETLGRHDFAEPLARRAVLAADGLIAIDERRSLAPGTHQEAGTAIEELRREEHARVFFRSDLLRTASRLESVHLIVARAAALQSSKEITDFDKQLHELTTELDAEEDLRGWLQRPR
jgi:hypothetical protein